MYVLTFWKDYHSILVVDVWFGENIFQCCTRFLVVQKNILFKTNFKIHIDIRFEIAVLPHNTFHILNVLIIWSFEFIFFQTFNFTFWWCSWTSLPNHFHQPPLWILIHCYLGHSFIKIESLCNFQFQWN